MSSKKCGSAIIEQPAGILLVTEYVDGQLQFGLPGGTQEDQETIYGCIVRETEEEAGIVIALRGIVGIYENVRTERGNHMERWVAAADILNGTPTAGKNQVDVGYFSKREIKKLERRDQLKGTGTYDAIERYRDGELIDLSILSVASTATHNGKHRKAKAK